MARFYSDENFPLQTVVKLRELGHDVVTALDAGNAINGSQMSPSFPMPYLGIVPF